MSDKRMNERGNDPGTEPSKHASDGDDVMRQTTPSQAEGERGKEEDEEQERKRRHGV
ncbi:hypothetical protein ABT034_23990 [Streptomyces sp. NPDC002773]|uniref:hypothetical protein n=1 Tax=Streptomyces sp. NPDC002773 TaxID=3154430 RepID=UPI0033196764